MKEIYILSMSAMISAIVRIGRIDKYHPPHTIEVHDRHLAFCSTLPDISLNLRCRAGYSWSDA